MDLPSILERLEEFYGAQEACWPTDPYLFIVWWHCGYPASDAACNKGWQSLNKNIGVQPAQLLASPVDELADALAPGGMVPATRARRLKEIAERVEREFGGDLTRCLRGETLPSNTKELRKALRKFPNIADPGADRILLFGGIAPIAAVPSNCPHVLVRIQRGLERENYGVNYRAAQDTISGEVRENFQARQRAYLLLKRHGQELCKSNRPKCEQCPVSAFCAYRSGNRRGRAVPT